MANFDEPSRCSGRKPLKFRWYGSPSAQAGMDLQTAIDKFELMIEAPNRVKNRYVTAMARAEFKKKIELAEKGALWPITEVRAVDKENPPPLYEIRWQGITVQECLADGVIEDVRILVRMYHSEPSEVPNHFVGHHVHEKDLRIPDDVFDLQNAEILVAKNYYRHGLPTLWGILDLT